jgi:hypothetical protein
MAQLENFRLSVFRAVAEHLNFHKAAQQLFLTQPAVTLQIKALESDLGVTWCTAVRSQGRKRFLDSSGFRFVGVREQTSHSDSQACCLRSHKQSFPAAICRTADLDEPFFYASLSATADHSPETSLS